MAVVFFFIGEEDRGHEGLGADEEGFLLSMSALFVESALPNEYDGLDVVTRFVEARVGGMKSSTVSLLEAVTSVLSARLRRGSHSVHLCSRCSVSSE